MNIGITDHAAERLEQRCATTWAEDRRKGPESTSIAVWARRRLREAHARLGPLAPKKVDRSFNLYDGAIIWVVSFEGERLVLITIKSSRATPIAGMNRHQRNKLRRQRRRDYRNKEAG